MDSEIFRNALQPINSWAKADAAYTFEKLSSVMSVRECAMALAKKVHEEGGDAMVASETIAMLNDLGKDKVEHLASLYEVAIRNQSTRRMERMIDKATQEDIMLRFVRGAANRMILLRSTAIRLSEFGSLPEGLHDVARCDKDVLSRIQELAGGENGGQR